MLTGLILWVLLGVLFTFATFLLSEEETIPRPIVFYSFCSLLGPLMGIILLYGLVSELIDNYRDSKSDRL
jgi:hypothetical protein